MTTRILENINSPEDIKNLDTKKLNQLSKEIREFIIDSVSKTGGHLASSLGVVEVTLALHYVFDFKEDKIVWDVGHQAYIHKILTGRKNMFGTLRQYNGLSGFPKITESDYDHFNTGHSSTSISATVGMAVARDLKGQNYQTIAFIGDGSLTAGLAFEGMNQAGHLKRKMIVILNDNDMSIAPNVGALSGYLNQIISGQYYNKFRDKVEGVLKSIPAVGSSMIKFAKTIEESIKRIFVPGMLFEELGFEYEGVVDGHDIEKLISILEKHKNSNHPVLIHIKTTKGKGYSFSENKPEKWHGASPFDIESGKSLGNPKTLPSYTEIFGNTVNELAEINEKIVCITAAMPSGTGLSSFAEKYPERFFDVGIAEQHGVTMAGGLAISGMRPIAAIYSSFLQRAYDQVIHDVCLMNLPVTFCLDRAGVVGADGETHHGLYDISFLRPLPNIVLMAPADENELRNMIYTSTKMSCPVAIRYPRGTSEGVKMDENFVELKVGESRELKNGEDAVVLAAGSFAWKAYRVAEKLEKEGFSIKVIDPRFLKPLDESAIMEAAEKCGTVITIEENILDGGFGSSVIELFNNNGKSYPTLRLGIPDRIIHQGSPAELFDEMQLSEPHLFYRIQNFVKKYKMALK